MGVNNSRDVKKNSRDGSKSKDKEVDTQIGTPQMLATQATRISATAGLTAGAVIR